MVFEVLTDIEIWRDEFAQVNRGVSFRLNYDRKQPFGIGNRIVLSKDTPIFISTITQYEAPYLLEMSVEPNKRYIDFLGVGYYFAFLEKISEKKTKYDFLYESSKQPKGFLKLVFWVYFHCSFFFANKRMKKRITSRLKNGRLTSTS